MRGGTVSAILRIAPVLGGLALLQCRREPPPPPASPPPSAALALDPWSWHFVGGLVVITGEVEDTVEVTLKGTTLNETRTLPFGPVRWELLRPPPGEVAELRAGGKLLMKFEFDKTPPPRAQPPAPVPLPEAAPPRSGPPPAPVRPAAAPKAPPPSIPVAAAPRSLAAPPPPRPKATPVAPPQAQPLPSRAAGTAPVRPVPGLIAPPAPAGVVRPSVPAPSPPGPPHPNLEPSPNPKVPPRTAPQPTRVARSTSNSPAVPPPSAKPAAPPPVPLPVGPSRDWPGAGEGLNLLRGPKGERRICMTFDGGSTAEVALDVLDALKSRGIRTTIFLTGDFIRKYPDLVRRIDRDGHEIGNHTLTHPHLAPSMRRDPRWTRERFQGELLEADRALFRLLGRPFDPYWRAPYGEQTPELRRWAEELGYRHVGWSEGADTLDWATVKERRLYRTGNAILDKLYARMEKQDGDGLIVLMHLGSGRPDGDRPGQVLGPFLDRAMKDGWHFVPMGEYVKGLGKPRWEPVRRVALLR